MIKTDRSNWSVTVILVVFVDFGANWSSRFVMVQISQSRSVLILLGPNRSSQSLWVQIGQHGPFGSKLVNTVPFDPLGPNWSVIVRIGRSGSKLVSHGPVWSFWANFSKSSAIVRRDKTGKFDDLVVSSG